MCKVVLSADEMQAWYELREAARAAYVNARVARSVSGQSPIRSGEAMRRLSAAITAVDHLTFKPLAEPKAKRS